MRYLLIVVLMCVAAYAAAMPAPEELLSASAALAVDGAMKAESLETAETARGGGWSGRWGGGWGVGRGWGSGWGGRGGHGNGGRGYGGWRHG